MRRVIRILGRVGAALSLLLCVAVAVGWIDSYFQTLGWRRTHYVSSSNRLRTDAWRSADGRVGVYVTQIRINPGPLVSIERTSGKEIIRFKDGSGTEYETWLRLQRKPIYPTHNWWERNVIFVRPESSERPNPVTEVVVSYWVVSYWVLFVVSGIWPALWGLGRWRGRRRFREGRCQKCGYDLRETPERCPECGAVAVGGGEAES